MKQSIISFMSLTVVLTLVSCSGKMEGSSTSKNNSELAGLTTYNKGSYSSVEFHQFKEENFRKDQYTENEFSEKVKFKAFVKHKEKASK